MPEWIIGIKVATIGDGSLEGAATLTDGRYRLASSAPSWDSSSVYKEVLASFPAEIGQRVDWSTGDVSISGLSFDLLATPQVLGWFSRARFTRLANLTAALTPTGTTLTADETTLASETIVVGREAIDLGTHAGAGVYPNVTRGVLGTTATEHGVGDSSDVEIFRAGEAPVFNLPVELFRVKVSGGYTTEETLWRGVLRSRSWSGDTGLLRLECDSALDVLSRTKICKRVWRAERSSVSTPRAQFYEGRPDRVPLVDDSGTAPYALLLSDGSQAWEGEWYETGNSTLADPSTSAPWAGGKALWTTDENGVVGDFGEEAWQIQSTATGAPAINLDGGRWSQNAYELTLQLLTTTADGSNGSYDLGVAGSSAELARSLADQGAGIPISLIDVDDIEAKRDLNPSAVLDGLHWPLESTDGIELLPFLRDKVLRPFGLTLVPGTGRKLTIRGIEDVDVTATAVSDVDFVGKPEISYDEVPAVDVVTFSYDARPGREPYTQELTNGYRQERSVGATQTTVSIDAGGVRSDPGSEGTSEVLRALGADFVSRYAWPIPVIRLQARRSLDLALGDVVSLTHRVIPDATGSKGITSERMVVSGVELELESGTIHYTFWWTSAGYNRTGRFCPSARVVSWSAGTGVATVEANAFLPSGSSIEGATTDAEVFAALLTLKGGSLVGQLLDADLRVLDSIITISAAGTNSLTLSGVGGTPAVGDVIVLSGYDSVGSVEQGRYAFLADTTPTVGSAGDTPQEWS